MGNLTVKKQGRFKRRNTGLFVWLLFLVLAVTGCSQATDENDRPPKMTYVIDDQVDRLIKELRSRGSGAVPEHFEDTYTGLTIPWAELEREPLVLALATQSPIPAILLLDAPWVKRYGRLGWLQDLSRADDELGHVFEKAPASVLEAFSLTRSGAGREAIMAWPHFVKGNVLFYRKDLLLEHCRTEEAPETWDELIAVAEKVMAGEGRKGAANRLKYGIIFHINNVENDFYPILWGFGAEVFGSETVLLDDFRPQAVAALDLLCRFVRPDDRGVRLGPGPGDFEAFTQPEALRKVFRRGEALFMINWNTRLGDLKRMMKETATGSGDGSGLTDLKRQVGWAPIPCRGAHHRRYVNIGSFGWGLNREALKTPEARQAAMAFLHVVSSVDLQYLAALRFAQIPSRSDAIDKLKETGEAPDVVSMFEKVFSLEDVALKARPNRRDINNIMAECTLMALQGQLSPDQAIDRAIAEMEKAVGK